MKLVLTSDCHGRLPVIGDPADILMITGDLCPNFNKGSKNWGKDGPLQLLWLEGNFIPWIASIDAKHKIVTIGNHDAWGITDLDKGRKILEDNGIILLIDQAVQIGGETIWGSPWTDLASFSDKNNWAFGLEKNDPNPYTQIPDDVTILLSHSPPKGVLDFCPHQKKHFGVQQLTDELPRLKNLKLIIAGHVHNVVPNYTEHNGVAIINAAETVVELEI